MTLDRLPVTACDGAGELEAGLDDAANQRVERLRRNVGGLEERPRRRAERDQVVGRDSRTRGVGGAAVGGAVDRPAGS